MSTSIYSRPYLAFVKSQASCNPGKTFIGELDRFAPTKIRHNAAFRLYKSQKGVADVWFHYDPADTTAALYLAVQMLSVHDDRQCAESLIRAWWKKHDIEPDEIGLLFVLDEAMRLTEQKRRNYQSKKEEERATMHVTKTRTHVLEYLSEQPGSPAEIAQALNMNRKAVAKQLERLCKAKQVQRDFGVYSVIGGKAA